MTRVAITHVAARGPYVAGSAPAEEPLANPRARKMMSRAAYLAACALAELMGKLGVSAAERAELGYFLGVGGSAGALDDVTALLDASFVDDAFSLPRFGDRGLAACNPLLAFQLMNNFTMCHGAILENLSGPNAALFSRGAGTIAALAEAIHAVRSGECARAIAGGADVATHPVTLAELARDGHLGRGLVPADGAALVALAASTSSDDVVLDGCAHSAGRGRPLVEALDDAFARASASASSWPIDAAGRAIAVASASAPSANAARITPPQTGAAKIAKIAKPRFVGPPAREVSANAVNAVQRVDLGDLGDLGGSASEGDAYPNSIAPSAAVVDIAASRSTSSAASWASAPTWARVHIVVLAACGPPAADALHSYSTARFPGATIVDASHDGETLAAGAAFAVIDAVRALRADAVDALAGARGAARTDGAHVTRAIVLSLGIDGDPGVVLLSRGGAA